MVPFSLVAAETGWAVMKGGWKTATSKVAVLSSRLGSGAELPTVICALSGSSVRGFTRIETVAEPPGASAPRLQTTVSAPTWQLPWLETADTMLTDGEKILVKVASVAEPGPALVTVSVYTRLSPTKTGSGAAEPSTPRSATASATRKLTARMWSACTRLRVKELPPVWTATSSSIH